MESIKQFRGKYYFLSNFYPCKITYNGISYLNAEAALHAQKDSSRSEEFKDLDASAAKKLGRNVTIRTDWDDVKNKIMAQILFQKFSNPKLRGMLLDTGEAELVESNTWHDTYWGVYNGQGRNELGNILMGIRYYYQSEIDNRKIDKQIVLEELGLA